MRLTWVDTFGGPHLVLPEKYAHVWGGGRSPQFSGIPLPTPPSDYERACAVKGWIGSVQVGTGRALVLTGDVLSAASYRASNGRHFMLRWGYAPEETALLDRLHDSWDRLIMEEKAEFVHPGGSLFLMDSVDVPGQWVSQHSEFDLSPARYVIQTSQVKNDDVWIVIHEFRRK